MNDSLLSKTTVMERLGVSDKTLRRLVKQGRLVAIKLGRMRIPTQIGHLLRFKADRRYD